MVVIGPPPHRLPAELFLDGLGGRGLRMIGRTDVLGVEWDESACLLAAHILTALGVGQLTPLDVTPPEGSH